MTIGNILGFVIGNMGGFSVANTSFGVVIALLSDVDGTSNLVSDLDGARLIRG